MLTCLSVVWDTFVDTESMPATKVLDERRGRVPGKKRECVRILFSNLA